MLEKEVATNAAAAAAALSSIMLSFFGVDHQSLFFGFMGAFFTYALRETSKHSRLKSVVFVLASAFIGGVFGMAFGSGAQPPRPNDFVPVRSGRLRHERNFNHIKNGGN